MEHPGDQTKIHLNPDFISRGGTLLNQKVHINPAFLQKSQGVHQKQKYVTPASSCATRTGYEQHWQGLTSMANRPTSQISASLLPTHDGNTATNVYSYSSKNVHNRTVLMSHPKSPNVYKKSNLYNPYDKSFSRYKDFSKTQNIAAKNSVVTKHPSTYSWKAANTNGWVSHQGNSSTSVKGQSNVNLVKDPAFVTQHYTYPNPSSKYSSVNKSFVRTTVTRRIGASQTNNKHKEDKPAVSHSGLHSLSHDKKDTQSVRTSNEAAINTTLSKHVSKIKSETTPSKTEAQRSYGKVTEKINPSLHIRKIKSETKSSDTLTQDMSVTLKKSDFIKAPKRESSNTCSPSKVQVPGLHTTSKSDQVTPNQKWVSKNKVVNSSSKKTVQAKVADHKSNSTKLTLKTPKQKDNYKIITKTKLVRTNSNSATRSKVQQQAVAGGQPEAQSLKATTYASPRVTTISRLQKIIPATRLHQTAARLNTKKKYSVLSRTKLVRRQSLSGKAGTPGKPKYSVNTKNKLIRRRSSSGTGGSKSPSKTSASKTKATKPETERQKKFHVLSKTKIVRRRSSSGAYKAVSAQGLAAATPGHSKKRAIVKRHKLVRNVSSGSLKHNTAKFNGSFNRNVNTAFKVINTTPKLSAKQRIAKGIISKYKINRLKLESYDGSKRYQKPFDYYKINRMKPESASGSRRYRKFIDYSSKSRQKSKFKFQNKKTCASKHSDRFINIGGILYKSTKTSLRKQLPKAKKTSVKKPNSTCTVFLRGEKFHLTAGGRTLQRVRDSTPAKSSLPRVHIGGLTYSRTRTGLYELTKTHQARAVLSSARQRSMVTLIQKRRKASFQKRNECCAFFNRFGRCSKKNRGECPYIHDPSRVAICTRFLRGRCPVNNCPFSHTVDPDKMPVCSHFLQAACTREDCPYRHVKVNPSAPVCLDFVRGYCKAGEECDKQHILVCEQFKTGKCPRGASCPLSHHKGRKRPRRVSFSRDANRRSSISIYRKRKISESLEILGGPVIKKRTEKKRREVKASSSHQRYFHVMATEESEDKDTQNVSENSELRDKGEKVHHEDLSQHTTMTESASNNRVSKEAEGPRDKVQKDQVVVCDNYSSIPTNKSVFEETRSRVMKRIDKIKKSYQAFSSEDPTENAMNSDTNSNMGDCKDELRDSCQPTNTSKEETGKTDNQKTFSEISAQNCNDTENPDSDTHRVQRPPLPKRLPSYIPLDSV